MLHLEESWGLLVLGDPLRRVPTSMQRWPRMLLLRVQSMASQVKIGVRSQSFSKTESTNLRSAEQPATKGREGSTGEAQGVKGGGKVGLVSRLQCVSCLLVDRILLLRSATWQGFVRNMFGSATVSKQ